MEEIIFTSAQAEAKLDEVQSALDKTTVRLYRKYGYLHDTYIKKINWLFNERGQCSCEITLFQDIVDPMCGLKVFIDDIFAWNCDFRKIAYRAAEIYYFYFFSHDNGIEIHCSTDGVLGFCIAARKVKIRLCDVGSIFV